MSNLQDIIQIRPVSLNYNYSMVVLMSCINFQIQVKISSKSNYNNQIKIMIMKVLQGFKQAVKNIFLNKSYNYNITKETTLSVCR